MELKKTETDNAMDLTEDSGVMRLLGIDIKSHGVVYLPPITSRKYFMGIVGTSEKTLQVVNNQFQLIDSTGNPIGTLLQPIDDIFAEALPKQQMSHERKSILLGNIAEMSKWLPLIEHSADPIREDVGFYNTRLIIAANLFSNLKYELIAPLKVEWILGVKLNDFRIMTQVENKLKRLIKDFVDDNPEYLKYFGVSEDYLFNLVHAQITIPSLVANRVNKPQQDNLTIPLLQDIAKTDNTILTALMMHRTARYLTGEVKKTASIDADLSQIISIAEIPPTDHFEIDSNRRSMFANMLGIYQDFAFSSVYPNVYAMGNTQLKNIYSGKDYLARTHYFLKVLPQKLNMGALTSYNPENIWTEATTKSAVSSVRKAALQEIDAISDLTDGKKFYKPDTNVRIDLFNRLEYLLLHKPNNREFGKLINEIENRLRNIELVRFRMYPPDEDFNNFVECQMVYDIPDIVTDVYEDKHRNRQLSSRRPFVLNGPSPLESIRNIKLDITQHANNLSHVYVALHWKKDLVKDGPTTSFQVAPISFLHDNMQTREVYLQ
jgi:hypothetical protein